MFGYSIKKDATLREMQRRAEMAEQRVEWLESDLHACEVKRDELSDANDKRGEMIRAYRDVLQNVHDELKRPMFNARTLRAIIQEALKK